MQQPKDALVPSATSEVDGGETRLELVAARRSSFASASPLVAECMSTDHPSLHGRVLCRLEGEGSALERWLPTLAGLPVRVGDRVLVVQPANHAEAIVTGVLDGFTPRPERPAHAAATRTLLADEVVRFAGPNGEPLVEIGPGPAGPVIRLLAAGVSVETRGRVALTAGEIELRAQAGSVRLDASDDVVVAGETIRLN